MKILFFLFCFSIISSQLGTLPFKIWQTAVVDLKMTEKLMKNYDVNTIDEHGLTLINYAILSANKPVLEFFLKYKPNLEITYDPVFRTPLLIAAGLGFSKIVELLINAGANINYQDRNGYTALIHAVQNKHLETVEVLLQNDCDISLKTKFGFDVFFYCGNKKIEDLLNRHVQIKKIYEKGLDGNLTESKSIFEQLVDRDSKF